MDKTAKQSKSPSTNSILFGLEFPLISCVFDFFPPSLPSSSIFLPLYNTVRIAVYRYIDAAAGSDPAARISPVSRAPHTPLFRFLSFVGERVFVYWAIHSRRPAISFFLLLLPEIGARGTKFFTSTYPIRRTTSARKYLFLFDSIRCCFYYIFPF